MLYLVAVAKFNLWQGLTWEGSLQTPSNRWSPKQSSCRRRNASAKSPCATPSSAHTPRASSLGDARHSASRSRATSRTFCCSARWWSCARARGSRVSFVWVGSLVEVADISISVALSLNSRSVYVMVVCLRSSVVLLRGGMDIVNLVGQ